MLLSTIKLAVIFESKVVVFAVDDQIVKNDTDLNCGINFEE